MTFIKRLEDAYETLLGITLPEYLVPVLVSITKYERLFQKPS